jgi:hypothetical protein
VTIPFLFEPQHLFAAAGAVGEFAKQVTVFLYVGPDQIMPLTSALGAIAGLALMFWNHLVGLARRALTLVTRRANAPQQDQPVR